jgi:hypothetical protein
MKLVETLLSLVVIFLGIIPFFGEKFFIPNKGMGYAIILILGGIIILVLAITNNMLMGVEKFVLALESGLLIVVGLIAFFPALLPIIPRDSIWQSIIIIAAGVGGVVYGFIGIG